MAVETESDRLTILSDFGVTADIVIDSSVRKVLGILDREYKDIGGIESYYPIFECRSSDVLGVSHGVPVSVGNDLFHVVSIEDDREGMTQLILSVGQPRLYGGLDAYTPENP